MELLSISLLNDIGSLFQTDLFFLVYFDIKVNNLLAHGLQIEDLRQFIDPYFCSHIFIQKKIPRQIFITNTLNQL